MNSLGVKSAADNDHITASSYYNVTMSIRPSFDLGQKPAMG